MAQEQRIEAVIFDLGRVIVDIDFSRSLFGLFGRFEGEIEEVIHEVMADEQLSRYNRGEVTPGQFYEHLRETLGLKVAYEEFVRRWCEIFSPMPGMEELLEELRGKVRLGLFSNTDPLHWDYLRRHFPVLEVFARPTLSFEIGVLKPARESYLKAAADVGTAVERCMYVDDLGENVSGAAAVGMEAVQFESSGQIRGELVKRGLFIE